MMSSAGEDRISGHRMGEEMSPEYAVRLRYEYDLKKKK